MGSPAQVQNLSSAGEDDRDLVVRARGGDDDAFGEIVRTYQRRIYGVALRMTRRHEVADDIVQDTFIRAHRSLDRFELGRPLAPWLVKIAVNLSINYLNGATKREQSMYTEDRPDGPWEPQVHEDASREPLESNPARSLMSAEFAAALGRALEKLSPEHRAVFMLKVDEGMRYEEIATTLGISRGTVMSRLFRARGKLKNLLEDYL